LKSFLAAEIDRMQQDLSALIFGSFYQEKEHIEYINNSFLYVLFLVEKYEKSRLYTISTENPHSGYKILSTPLAQIFLHLRSDFLNVNSCNAEIKNSYLRMYLSGIHCFFNLCPKR